MGSASTRAQAEHAGEATRAAVSEPYLLIEIGGHECAVRIADVQEIVPLCALSHPAGMPLVLDGFLTLEQEPVPVVGAARLWDMAEHEPGLYTPLIIVRTRSGPLALLADRVLRVTNALAKPCAEGTELGSALPSVLLDGHVVGVVDPDRVLLETERETIEHLRANEANRVRGLEGVAA